MKSLMCLLCLFMVCFSAQQQLFAQVGNLPEKIETVVDKPPKLKNAGNNFARYIQKKIEYPANAKLRVVEGDVWVAFVISSTGVVKNVEVEKSVDVVLDQSVIEFVKQTGPWKPGEKNGEKVNTAMLVPVKFTLNENERNLARQLKSFDMLDSPPLFVLDSKIVEGYIKIEDYNVESIRVIKGSKAVALYGSKGKNGVVLITSKRGTPPVY